MTADLQLFEFHKHPVRVVMVDEWRAVPGYEGIYEVSAAGQVRSVTRSVPMPRGGFRQIPQALMASRPDKGGYLRLVLSRDGRQECRGVHQLVARAFLPDSYFDGAHVLHDDGNPANNHVSNLKWGTPSENVRDAVRHGTQWQIRKTHCPQGHQYDQLNTRVTIRGARRSRECRACGRERAAQKRARRLGGQLALVAVS